MSGKVVITGMGVVCPSGVTIDEFETNLWQGKNSIVANDFPIGDGKYTNVWAGRVVGFDPRPWLGEKIIEGTDLGQQYAIVAAEQAKQDAKIDEFDPLRTAIVSGTSAGGAISLQQAQYLFDKKGFASVPPKTMIRIFGNMAAAQMAMRWSLHGPQITLCQACATGVDVVGTAADLVGRGRVDVALAGSYEATNGFDHAVIDEGFVPSMRAAQIGYGMTPDPEMANPMRPFDKRRTGVVSAEGSAFVILESEEHAAARGKTAWAAVEGYGSLGEGYHPSSPEPHGRWEEAVIRQALDDAGVTPDDIDAVLAHGTATPKGDAAEINALNAVFGDRATPIPVTSVKGHMGHAGAASGCIAIIAAVLGMRKNSLVHTAGTTDVEDAAQFDVVTERPRPLEMRRVLVNAFGFGGQDAAIVIAAPN